MRILAPASNLEDVRKLLDHGADDIYLGAVSDVFQNYSYNGRSIRSKQGKIVSPGFNEVSKICSFLHERGGQVYFLANTPFLYDGQEKNSKLREGFIDYVRNGISSGADYIVLGDIGAIRLVRAEFSNIAIAASSYLEIQNEMSLKLLEGLGVSQAILSYQTTLEDIKYLSGISTIDIEIFGHGGCSFYVGSCNLFHEMGEEPIHMGYPCRATYQVKQAGINLSHFRVLDNFKMCSLCSIPELLQCNIKSMKIVGRDLEAGYILQLVKTYKNAIDEIKAGKHLDMMKEKLPGWWKRAWCESGCLCKYR